MSISLPPDWRVVTVRDIAAPEPYSLVGNTFGSKLPASEYTSSGVPILRGMNLSGPGRFNPEGVIFISETKANELFSQNAVADDIIFTQQGSVGQVGIIPSDSGYPRWVVSQSQMKLRADTSRALPLYIYYYFRQPAVVERLKSLAVVTGVPHINLGILRSFPIVLPPLPEQHAIAHILGTLDDKIELNRRMNETLEAMARALFKSWFADFDPVRAKAEGRQPVGMDAETAALFPDSLVESELGKIPEEWRIAELGDIADIIDCLHSKKPLRQERGRPLLQLWNIRDNGLIDMSDTYWITEADYEAWTARMEARQGDCVITNVGRVGAVAQLPPGLSAALGRNMTGLRCKLNHQFPTFLLEILLSSSMREEIARKTDAGTILDALNVRNISKLQLVLPTKELVSAFESRCRPIRALMEQNLAENRTLITIRSTLLPKLLSGEIRVREAEKLVEMHV